MKKSLMLLAAIAVCNLYACQSGTSTDTRSTALADLPATDSVQPPIDSLAPLVVDSFRMVEAADTAKLTLTDIYWKLTELHGKPVPEPKPGQKEMYIRFKTDGSLEGFAGCNGIGGKYELLKMDRIRLTNIMGTMMACDIIEMENEFREVLQTADNFNLINNKLVLNKAKMAPLARFVGKVFAETASKP